MIEAYSVREYSGIARWLAVISGLPVQWTGEDARVPESLTAGINADYWGLQEGDIVNTKYEEYTRFLVTSRTFTFTIQPGVAHTYLLVVGSTVVSIVVTALTLQSGIPALLVAAWAFAGLGLASNGTPGGYTLTPIDAVTFNVSGSVTMGGLPAFEYGYGFVQIAEVISTTLYKVQVETVSHTILATYWGGTRGRGIAKRRCNQVAIRAGDLDNVDLLIRCTGQNAEVSVLTTLDRNALADGSAASTQDVAQISIDVDAVTVQTVAIDRLAGVSLQINTLTEVTSDVFLSTIAVNVETP